LTRDELSSRLASLCQPRLPALPGPTSAEWRAIEGYFRCIFPAGLVLLYDVVGAVWFPGELLWVSVAGDLRGDDCIITVYEAEQKIGEWPERMIPFYSIGNGDYLCIARDEGAASRVFCVAHQDRSQEVVHPSVGDWLGMLSEYV
jgi:hypothetical protein